MNTIINRTELSSWGSDIYNINNEAISSLNTFKQQVNSLPKAYESASTDAIISNITSDLDNAINCHTDMESLQAFLNSVIAASENA